MQGNITISLSHIFKDREECFEVIGKNDKAKIVLGHLKDKAKPNLLALKFTTFKIKKNKERTKYKKKKSNNKKTKQTQNPKETKEKKKRKRIEEKREEVPVQIFKDDTDLCFISLVFKYIIQTSAFLGCSLFQSHYFQQFDYSVFWLVKINKQTCWQKCNLQIFLCIESNANWKPDSSM